MQKRVVYIALVVSVLLNIILLFVLLFGNLKKEGSPSTQDDKPSKELITEKAKDKIKEYVCSILYLPESYDPVDLQVDSAFYGIQTDVNCVQAALELIELRQAYRSAKVTYEEKVNDVRTFGGSGVFRHLAVERDNAKSEMEELEPKIAKCELTLRNRDTSHDGTFVGWWVYNRYRAKTNSGNVTFSEVYVLYDIHLEKWYVQYELDKNKQGNIEQLKEIFKEFTE